MIREYVSAYVMEGKNIVRVTPSGTEADNGAVVRSIVPRQRDNNRMLWDVIVTYDSEEEPS